MKTYAPFFEWPDKPQKEVGVAEQLMAYVNRARGLGWHSLQPQQSDPPDCVCSDFSGARIAIEVAEVVCSEAAARTARGENVMRLWEPGDAAAHIQELLLKKDGKQYLGGPYKELVACLFTDEFDLDFEELREELKNERFGPMKQITSAYLVFSYSAQAQSYPVLPLELAP
jgi:hypothetical protein